MVPWLVITVRIARRIGARGDDAPRAMAKIRNDISVHLACRRATGARWKDTCAFRETDDGVMHVWSYRKPLQVSTRFVWARTRKRFRTFKRLN